jgi:putative Mn2+ efflux pump MntP
MELVVLGIFLGLDNLAVASGLGLLGVRRGQRVCFAVSCTCFETLMPICGLFIGLGLRSRIGPAVECIGPICLVACGLLVLSTVMKKRENHSILDRPLAMVLLPLTLSLDNLMAGISLGTAGARFTVHAAVIGVVSGIMSVAGFAIGKWFRPRSTFLTRALAGSWLIACAAFCFFGNPD